MRRPHYAPHNDRPPGVPGEGREPKRPLDQAYHGPGQEAQGNRQDDINVGLSDYGARFSRQVPDLLSYDSPVQGPQWESDDGQGQSSGQLDVGGRQDNVAENGVQDRCRDQYHPIGGHQQRDEGYDVEVQPPDCSYAVVYLCEVAPAACERDNTICYRPHHGR